jgi:predicted small lipoprotein YifL
MVSVRTLLVAAMIALAAMASGCGKKGALTSPADSTYPRPYPQQ